MPFARNVNRYLPVSESARLAFVPYSGIGFLACIARSPGRIDVQIIV